MKHADTMREYKLNEIPIKERKEKTAREQNRRALQSAETAFRGIKEGLDQMVTDALQNRHNVPEKYIFDVSELLSLLRLAREKARHVYAGVDLTEELAEYDEYGYNYDAD